MKHSALRQAIFTCILGAILAVPAPASEQPLWKIGQHDDSSSEFTQGWFSLAPYRPVIYRIGQSTPSKGWPAVQPSDYDPQGRAQDHPFTILFPLNEEPRGAYVLRIHAFFDCLYYPDMQVEINGHRGVYFFHPKPIPVSSPYWRYSGNDLILATDTLEAITPAAFLKKGENRLVLTAVHGMHLQYDDLEFLQSPSERPAPIVSVQLKPTVLYRATEGTPEVVELDVRTSHVQGPLSAEIRIGDFVGRETASPNGQEFGDLRLNFDVPSNIRPQSALITVRMGNTRHEVTLPFAPAKKWLVYAAPTTHDDVGYREVQPRTQEWQNKVIDDVIATRKKYPWYKYNLEAAWVASDYLAHRSPEVQREFLDLARMGEIGINAFYADMETNALTPEEMARSFYLSGRFHRKYGVPMDAAAQGDMPSYPGGLPTFLASAGIKFFVGGSDQIRAPIYRNAALGGQTPLNFQSPFFWEGPDGSRVLTWMAMIYAQLGRLVWGYPRHDGGFSIVSRDPSEKLLILHKSLPLFLLNYTRENYPYDAILLYGLYGDDHPFGDGEASILADWNQRYTYPKIIVCRLADFADHILKDYSQEIPVLKGDMGAYWADGYSTASREIAWAREAQAALPAAEAFSTLATLLNPRLGFPNDQSHRAWDRLLQTDEHTWGDELVEARPHSQRSVEEAEWKSDMARDAWLSSRWMLRQALEQLRTPLEIPFQTVAVFNPLSWTRSGPVEADLEPGETLIDPVSGNPVPYAVVRRGNGYGRVRFWASEVPPLGYKVYQIRHGENAGSRAADTEGWVPSTSGLVTQGETAEPQSSPPTPLPDRPVVVEGKYYRLQLDPRTGAIKSLFDRRLGRELVDSASPYGLNEYLYVPGASGTMLHANTPEPPPPHLQISTARATQIDTRQVSWGTRILVKATAPETPNIESEIDVYDTAPRIDITNRVDKKPTFSKEAAYFAFPFAASHPDFSYPSVTGWFRPNEDQLPGAAKEWFLVQRAVRITDGHAAIVWASRDAAVATFQDIVRGTWPVHLPIKNGWIFSWVFNNYWYTNWPPAQGGHFVFRYSLTSAPAISHAAATRFGMELRQPLIPFLTRAEDNDIRPPFGSTGPITKPEGSFLNLAPNDVVLLTLKPAEVGPGLIARLQEIGGYKTTAQLSLPGVQVTRASLCNLVEEVQHPLVVSGGAVEVPLEPYGIATVKLETSQTGATVAKGAAR